MSTKRLRQLSPSKANKSVLIKVTPKQLEDLPAELLVKIFSQLSLRDLCLLEQVSKTIGRCVQLVWQSLVRLNLSESALFGGTRHLASSQGVEPKQVLKAFECVLSKCKSIKHLNLSEYAQAFLNAESTRCFQIIADKCPNLTYLNMSKHRIQRDKHYYPPFSNYHFNRMARTLLNLNCIDLRFCPVNDSNVRCILENCKYLESIDLSYCKSLTGKCFQNIQKLPHLRLVLINYCNNLVDEYLVDFLNQNGSYLMDSMEGFYASCSSSSKLTAPFYDAVVANLKGLHRLALTCFQPEYMSQLHLLKSLTDLDLSSSEANNEAFALILNNCTRLKSLNLSWCVNLSDAAFTTKTINAPLQNLDVSYASTNLTDLTLSKLSIECKHLKELRVACCSGLTPAGLIDFITQMPLLGYLNVSNLNEVDNSFMEAISRYIESQKRQFYVSTVCCNNLDVEKFLATRGPVKRKLMKGIMYEIECGHLTLEIDIWDETENETEDETEGEEIDDDDDEELDEDDNESSE